MFCYFNVSVAHVSIVFLGLEKTLPLPARFSALHLESVLLCIDALSVDYNFTIFDPPQCSITLNYPNFFIRTIKLLH